MSAGSVAQATPLLPTTSPTALTGTIWPTSRVPLLGPTPTQLCPSSLQFRPPLNTGIWAPGVPFPGMSLPELTSHRQQSAPTDCSAQPIAGFTSVDTQGGGQGLVIVGSSPGRGPQQLEGSIR